ncbi:SAM hydroxide adenosyltransferase [Jiangella endophytica]|uniref:SAM hydroxide adenosyltransferase n=1 Tax=Jiangella endophytica TaxID=1623398 RepID=UPI000E34A6D9|nr:SAM hydroxide adenosyltransferase [Jiangella endophytica]
MYPPITYLTDCSDTNARARLATRMAALFGRSPVLLPLDGPAPVEAAGLTLLDVLLSTRLLGEDGFATATLVNVAPRDGRWPNGAPFGWFRHGRHTVFTTYDPVLLEPVRRHLGVTSVSVTDARTVLAAAEWAAIGEPDAVDVAATQFRSLWYLPLLAKWVLDDRPVPFTAVELPAPDRPDAVHVALVDNFGNCKLTCTAADLGVVEGDRVAVGPTKVPYRRRLSDVPVGTAAVVTGSSGPGLLELVVNGGSAAAEFGLRAGDAVVLQG